MSDIVTYMLIAVMSVQAIISIVKLSGQPAKYMVGMGIVWGLVAYVSLTIMSTRPNINTFLPFSDGWMFVVTFVESAIMVSYSLISRLYSREDMVSRILTLYPGLTVLFPILYAAPLFITSFTGLSFSILAVFYGLSTAVVIIIMALVIRLLFTTANSRSDCIYYLAVILITLSILLDGFTLQQ